MDFTLPTNSSDTTPTVTSVPVMTFDATARERFHAAYFRHKYPVVVKGAIDAWPARQWDLDYLTRQTGERVVRVRHSASERFVSPAEAATTKLMPFAEAAALIDSPAGAGHYVLQQSLRRTFPGLLGDIGELSLLNSLQFVLQSNFWLGATGCKTHLHYDLSDNFLIQIRGVKKLFLYPDFLGYGLYPDRHGPMPFCSRLDVFGGVDTAQFPLYPEVNGARHEVTLHPGDLLYIPRRWWHAVETVETAVSLNFWWNSVDSLSETRELASAIGTQGWWGLRYQATELAKRARLGKTPGQ
ncbi:cupin-like domain-containing protein [Nocardia sp. NBC_00511]|uniref:cupin-like domain-containing protein n=1 Tax=Nocardia sp. NBC_00511 TaxID=2903591 RepID=UPI0030DFF2B6